MPIAAQAVEALGPGNLKPIGAVRDALLAGRSVGTGDPAATNALMEDLRTGALSNPRPLLPGVKPTRFANGEPFRVDVASPHSVDLAAVVKAAEADAAQEEFGSKLARALGIDHLVPAAARRANGSAYVELRPGVTFHQAGILTTRQLDEALTVQYLARGSLSPTEAAQAGRIDRQLLQAFDYLIANVDRHGSNALIDLSDAVRVSFIDQGLIGRGVGAEGGSVLAPVLRLFQNEAGAEHVALDPAVVALIKRRLTPHVIEALHAEVFLARGVAGPRGGTSGARHLEQASTPAFVQGMRQRLQHLIEHAGYDTASYHGDAVSPVDLSGGERRNVEGLGNVKNQIAMRMFG